MLHLSHGICGMDVVISIVDNIPNAEQYIYFMGRMYYSPKKLSNYLKQIHSER